MFEQKATLVINAIVNKENMAEMPTYLESVMTIFVKNGGKPVKRYKAIQQLAGDEASDTIALFEFANAEVINEMVNGVDFIALAELRARVFSKLNMVICHEM